MFQRCAKTRKKEVAACIAAAWLILFGIALAEGLGLYEDTPENLDQQFEQVLSSDAITGAQAPDVASVADPWIAVVASLPSLGALCAGPRFPVDIGEHIARMTSGLRLYQLHSTYLI